MGEGGGWEAGASDLFDYESKFKIKTNIFFFWGGGGGRRGG